jgi:hypothetical protein
MLHRRSAGRVRGWLDMYLAPRSGVSHRPRCRLRWAGVRWQLRILSAYSGAVVPDTDAVHNVIGVALLARAGHGEAAAASARR